MSIGTVNTQLEANISLRVRGPVGIELDFDAVIDTRFSSSLTLPISVVMALGLTRQSVGSAVLRDGSIQFFDVYTAEVEWDGTWRPVVVWAVGDETLVGMKLLAGNELRIAVVTGGAVENSPIP